MTLALALSALSQHVRVRAADEAMHDSLTRDHAELEAMLKLDARARLDALAPLAASAELQSMLRKVDHRDDVRNVDPRVAERIRGILESLNRPLEDFRATMMFVTDTRGVVVGQIGGDKLVGTSYAAVPLVERAISGFLRDDVWASEGTLVRMAARPVVSDGQYVGAIVHGQTLTPSHAELLCKRLGGPVIAFVLGDKIAAGHVPADAQRALRVEDLLPPLAGLQDAPSDAKANAQTNTGASASTGDHAGQTSPLRFESLQQGAIRAVYAPLTGRASRAGARVILARPMKVGRGVFSVLADITGQDIRALPWLALMGLLIGLLVVGHALVWVERDKPIRAFLSGLEALAQGKLTKLNLAECSGPYRQAAEHINTTVMRARGEDPNELHETTSDLHDMLASADSGSTSFYGFAEQPRSSMPAALVEEVPSIPPETHPGVALPDSPSASAQAPFAAPPAPVQPAAAAVVQRPAPPPVPPAPVASAIAPPQAGALERQTVAMSRGQDREQIRDVGRLGHSVTSSGAVHPVNANTDATELTELPEHRHIREDTAVAAHPHPSAASSESDDAHYRSVYEAYLMASRQCGVSVQGLTYEKFLQTLDRTKQELVQKRGVQRVQFSVYIKDGKAALKATPVRDS